ncbi:cupin domain-containing protein [Plantibacter sp. Mn2098]|uniref:cupin domain-containing protein n=1 Tax=Plantibacter sp. Mn2098 TaxID=3395266 RepID=UPI003BCF7C3B
MSSDHFELRKAETLHVPAERMIVRAWIELLGAGIALSRVRLVKAYLEPGARTVWHCHHRGQTIHVTDGVLLTQERGTAPERFTAGQTSVCAPGVWHWHGADDTHLLAHIAVIEEEDDGGEGTGAEPVTQEKYAAALRS